LKQAPRKDADVDEKIRDPPPPANFPPICPRNPTLKPIIKRLDRDVFQKNGLHHIPYRDSNPRNLPLPVFDGEKWPETEQLEEEDLLTIDFENEEVIDVWTQRKKQQQAQIVAEMKQARFKEVPLNSLKKIINAIKYPTEMKLLPHIIREWRRQAYPITLVDAQKIARLATKHDEVEVILQMTHPEVYGLYYDMAGLREITRGLAKRTATVEQSKEKRFTPERMLATVPELLRAAVGEDAKNLLKDPGVMGNQLWGLVARFVRDPNFRNEKTVLEICGLGEQVVRSVRDYDFESLFPADISSVENSRQIAFNMKYHTADFLPLLYALRQLVEILRSPYRLCAEEVNNATFQTSNFHRIKKRIADFLKHRYSTFNIHYENLRSPEFVESTPYKWYRLNQLLAFETAENHLRLTKLQSWQQELLKQYTTIADEVDASNEALPESFHLPLTAEAALSKVEDILRKWNRVLKEQKIPVKTDFKLDVQSF